MLKNLLKKIIPFKARRIIRKIESRFHYGVGPMAYQLWIGLYDRLKPTDIQKMREEIRQWDNPPFISVMSEDPLHREAMNQQIYSHWEIASSIESVQAEWVACVDRDAILTEDALYQVAKVLREDPTLDLIYSDADEISAKGIRHSPYFKTDWDPYLILEKNYLRPFFVIRKTLMEQAQNDANALRANSIKVKHVPLILCHARRPSLDQLQRHGMPFSLPLNPPLISILIPTKDRLDLLKPCIESLFNTIENLRCEVLIINNHSEKPEMLAYLKSLEQDARVRVLDYPKPFNYSALNNFAAEEAKGEILLLMNDDVEAIRTGWLHEMLGLILQKDVGIVGAKLYYPNHTVQHAGVVLGIQGTAFHIETGLAASASGYFSQLKMRRCFSAVTAACLMIRKDLYEKVGGLDAVLFPITFNDTDLCLKVRALGYHIVWTPYAELYHKESATRGEDIKGEKLARTLRESAAFKEKWGARVIENDPFYNPNLTLKRNDYGLAFPPRIKRVYQQECHPC